MKTSKKLLVKLLKNNGDSMEKWFLYDKDRNPLNKTVERDSLLLKGEFHLSVHAWIKCEDKYLIFQRDETKKIFPNFYEPIAGGVDGEEDSFMAIVREVKEESGLTVDASNLLKKFSVVNDTCKYPEICDVFIFKLKFDLSDIRYEKGKNKNAKLVSKDEIIQMINDKEFLPLVIYNDQIESF